jgi:hypothetical protein
MAPCTRSDFLPTIRAVGRGEDDVMKHLSFAESFYQIVGLPLLGIARTRAEGFAMPLLSRPVRWG